MRYEDMPHMPFPEVATSVLKDFEVRHMKPNEDSCETCANSATISFAIGNHQHRLCDDCAAKLCKTISNEI